MDRRHKERDNKRCVEMRILTHEAITFNDTQCLHGIAIKVNGVGVINNMERETH